MATVGFFAGAGALAATGVETTFPLEAVAACVGFFEDDWVSTPAETAAALDFLGTAAVEPAAEVTGALTTGALATGALATGALGAGALGAASLADASLPDALLDAPAFAEDALVWAGLLLFTATVFAGGFASADSTDFRATEPWPARAMA
ncbi:MAG: hypothetical protein EBT08_17050 [Betaproteobacteria bacterium]|nr:hypothetical protein [Betaproteobacteria bacterium]